MILSIITNKNDTEITLGINLTKNSLLLDKNLEILIVEDEILLAMAMKCTLNDFGLTVSGIEVTAKNAIEHVKNKKPNLIFMDICLKGIMSGTEAAKFIWKNYKIPIIFLTSYSDTKTINEAISSEPYGYLIKPAKDEEILTTITTTMHKHNFFFKNKAILEKTNDNKIYLIEGFSFDKTKGVLYKEDKALILTGNEVKLFEILSDYINEPVNFDRIKDYIWRDDFCDISKLRSLIYRLKNKIGINLIENVFEVGYKLKTK
jgi:two-component system, response regulator PdtaR